jgi:phosphoribosylformylglycinamidine synthase
MKAAVLVFPGSNREGDVAQAIELVTGRKPQMIWHGDGDFEKTDLIVVPGGFSYGDYLRCGAMAAQSPVMAEVKRRAARCWRSATASRSPPKRACCRAC